MLISSPLAILNSPHDGDREEGNGCVAIAIPPHYADMAKAGVMQPH